MEKRTLLALILIMLVFWISNEFIWKPRANQATEQNQTQSEDVVKQETESLYNTDNELNSELENPIEIDENIIESDIDINNNIILENDKMKITFSNQGAAITSIIIKDYSNKETGNPVELVPQNQQLFNIELNLRNGNDYRLDNHIFNYETIENGQGIKFYTYIEEGLLIKEFVIDANYELQSNINIQNIDLNGYDLKFDSGIADTEEYLIKHPKDKLRDYKLIAQVNNEIEKLTLSKLQKNREETGKIDWLALRSKYFVLGLSIDDLVNSERLSGFSNLNSPAAIVSIKAERNTLNHEFELYFGPILASELKEFRVGFEKVTEGPFIEILRPIANGFAWMFKQFRKVIPSYGLIVIIIAILLKIVLYPLTHKSFESTQKMQTINPLMKEIQKKYKDNPQKMNAELQKLYKEHGVSPLGGCLPMLLQMPIIFAIYPVIRYSLDMRQASFMWLPDLSEPDQLMILPIAMAVFMFIQQKLMSPSKAKLEEMDEKQKAAMQSQRMMMYFMPVMMFFIFKSLSSGLVLYWTVFSIIGTIQQYFIKKKFN